jgi:hypothetical protein
MKKANSPEDKVNAEGVKEHLTEIEVALIVEFLSEHKEGQSLPTSVVAHLEECRSCRKAVASSLDFFLEMEEAQSHLRAKAAPTLAEPVPVTIIKPNGTKPWGVSSILKSKRNASYAAAAAIAILITTSILVIRRPNDSAPSSLLAIKKGTENKNSASSESSVVSTESGIEPRSAFLKIDTSVSSKAKEGKSAASNALAAAENRAVSLPNAVTEWEAIENQWSANFEPIALLEALLNKPILNHRADAAASNASQILIDTESVSPAPDAKISKEQFFKFYLVRNNSPFNDKILLEIRKVNNPPIRYELTGDSSGFYTQVFPENLEPGLYYWKISRGIEVVYLNKFRYYGGKS